MKRRNGLRGERVGITTDEKRKGPVRKEEEEEEKEGRKRVGHRAGGLLSTG